MDNNKYSKNEELLDQNLVSALNIQVYMVLSLYLAPKSLMVKNKLTIISNSNWLMLKIKIQTLDHYLISYKGCHN